MFEFHECPICGGSIRAWESRVYYGVSLEMSSDGEEVSVEHGEPEHAEIEEIFCENNHSEMDMIVHAGKTKKAQEKG